MPVCKTDLTCAVLILTTLLVGLSGVFSITTQETTTVNNTGCTDFTYGPACNLTCSCEKDHSEKCNEEGTCLCKDGWNGQSCADDIDECADDPDICNDALKICNNTWGSYGCHCISGYTMNDQAVCVGPSIGEVCTNSSYCTDDAACLCSETACDSRTCTCGQNFFQNKTTNDTCSPKISIDEECLEGEECTTWLARCTRNNDASDACQCEKDHVYSEENDECTNAVLCARDPAFIRPLTSSDCFRVLVDCPNCTDDVQGACEAENPDAEGEAVGLVLNSAAAVYNFIDILWFFGFYSASVQDGSDILPQNETGVVSILLSANQSSDAAGKVTWYWPNGDAVENLEIEEEEDGETAVELGNSSCLYMVYGGRDTKIRVNESCDLTTVLVGCMIKLPSFYCEVATDSYGMLWPYTAGGTTLNQTCPEPNEGIVTRECTTGGRFKEAYYNCSLPIVQDIYDELTNGTIDGREALGRLTTNVTTEDYLYIADVIKVKDTLNTVTQNETADDTKTDMFLEVASYLIEPNNSLAWESQLEHDDTGAETLLSTVDNYVEQVLHNVGTSAKTISIAKQNLVLEVQPVVTGSSPSISFPHNSPQVGDGVNREKTPTLFLDQKAFTGSGVKSASSLLYKTLPNSVSSRRVGDRGSAREQSSINSQILSLTLYPRAPPVLNPKLIITLQQLQTIPEGFELQCSYWDVDSNGGKGAWSTAGCQTVYSNVTVYSNDTVQCECDHLTNFAILLSPIQPSEEHGSVLRIISLVGCSISILFLLVTITLYSCFWKFLKSDNAILTLVLSVCLCAAYIVFIIAVELTSHMHKDVCTAVAVALHYLYLLVFFVMLAQGLNMMTKVMMVYNRKSYVRQFLIGAFIAPAIIVIVSAGASKLEGYGNENYCWLPPGRGVFWAFLGPVCCIILTNFIIGGLVFCKLHHTSTMKNKSFLEKTRLTAWTLCILVPIMGVTWVFGVFSVSEEQVFWQYIFVPFNTLQGFWIFLFHCLLNKQVRAAVKAHGERKRTVGDFNSELKGRLKKMKRLKHVDSDASSRCDTATTSVQDSATPTLKKRYQARGHTGDQAGDQARDDTGDHTGDETGGQTGGQPEEQTTVIP